MLIELFSLGVTAEALRANIGSKSAFSLQQGQFDPKFQVEGVAPPTILLRSHKRRLNGLSYGIKIWAELSSVLSQSTRLTDSQTDGQTASRDYSRPPIQCSAVKTVRGDFKYVNLFLSFCYITGIDAGYKPLSSFQLF